MHPIRLALLAGLFATTAIAQEPPAVEWHPHKQLEQQLAKQTPWLRLLDRSTMRLGRYRLRKGQQDQQSPHALDEAYYVIAGKAKFTAAGETREVQQGDLVFVAARAKHHFHDITEDLDLLVMFSTAVPSTGGMRAGPAPTEQTPYPETSPRGATRVFYWFGPNSAGQVHVAYGRPRWQSKFGTFLKQPTGRRWRFGENFWTTLDTNMPLTIAGVRVEPGMYYAVLQHTKQHGLQLLLLDPSKVRKQRLDAYEANKTTGGLAIPLQTTKANVSASRLTIELSVDRKQRDRGALTITFGPNELRADVQMHPDR